MAQAVKESKSPHTLIEGWINERALTLEFGSDQLAAVVELFRYVDEVLDEIRGTDWGEGVTLVVFDRIEKEKKPVYERAHGGDQAAKNRLNKRIGARVKEGLGAVTRSARRGGPPRKGNVSHGLIRTYTKLWKD